MIEDSRSTDERLYQEVRNAEFEAAAAERETAFQRGYRERVVLRRIGGEREAVLETEGVPPQPRKFFRSAYDRADVLFGRHGEQIARSESFRADLREAELEVARLRGLEESDFTAWDRKHFMRSLSERTARLRRRFGLGRRWTEKTVTDLEALTLFVAKLSQAAQELFLRRELGRDSGRLVGSAEAEKIARLVYCVRRIPSLARDPESLSREQEALRMFLNRSARRTVKP